MNTTPEELERMVQKVRTELEGKKQVFPVLDFPEDHVVVWEGEDIGPFLDMCQRCGGALVYMRELRITEAMAEEEVFSGRVGEMLELEVAFLQDGYFHKYAKVADWFENYSSGLEEESRITDCILRLAKEDISEEFIKEFLRSGNEDLKFEFRLYEFISDMYHLPDTDPMVYLSLGNDAERAFSTFTKNVENKLIDRLVPRLIEWLGKNKLDKVQKADVQVFLSENRLNLNSGAVTVLWRKAKYRMNQTETDSPFPKPQIV